MKTLNCVVFVLVSSFCSTSFAGGDAPTKYVFKELGCYTDATCSAKAEWVEGLVKATCEGEDITKTRSKWKKGKCRLEVYDYVAACDDGNASTPDVWDPVTESCVSACPAQCAKDADCDDGDPCTGDYCSSSVGGFCFSYSYYECQACTKDADCANLDKQGCEYETRVYQTWSCWEKKCQPTYYEYEACQFGCASDGFECLTQSVNCDDSNACTTDSYDSVAGACKHIVVAGCKVCTVNADCASLNTKACSGTVAGTVNYGCGTNGVCVPVTSGSTQCNDGNICNGVETCVAGACKAGTAAQCDDSDPTTTDSCDTITGCKHVAQPSSFAKVEVTCTQACEIHAWYGTKSDDVRSTAPFIYALSKTEACSWGISLKAKVPNGLWFGDTGAPKMADTVKVFVNGVQKSGTYVVNGGNSEGNLVLSKAELGCP